MLSDTSHGVASSPLLMSKTRELTDVALDFLDGLLECLFRQPKERDFRV
jgi:hypothetical protein